MKKIIKNWLKKIQSNEPLISTLLGGVVVAVVGILIFNYFSNSNRNQEEEKEIITSTNNQEETKYISNENGEIIPQNLPATHIVTKGENLWKISEKYYTSGYNWVDIAKENHLANPNYLVEGQELKLPQVAIRQPRKTTAEDLEKLSIKENTYTVQKGDCLWKIAVRAYGDGYKWTQIARDNNLKNPNYIEVGQILTLPR